MTMNQVQHPEKQSLSPSRAGDDIPRQMVQSRLSLIRYSRDHSLDDLLKKALDDLGEIVDSPIGFYHFIAPDQNTVSLQQWSTRTLEEFCNISGKGSHYRIDEAGVWVDCVRRKKPVVVNDYAALEHKKGLPADHAPVVRVLTVPVIRDNGVVAVLGVGNKPGEYTGRDVDVVSYYADVTWEIVLQKRLEEQMALQQHIDQELSGLAAQLLTQTSLADIAEMVLSAAKKLTKSRYGYVGTYDGDRGVLISHTMSRDIWHKCDIPDKSIEFEKCTGLFGWVIDNREPLMLNRIDDDPRSCGTPDGHIKIDAFLCVPALIDGELVGQISLANPENQYLDIDMTIALRLADLLALAVQRQNYHDYLLDAETRKAEELEKIVRQRTHELMESKTLMEKIFSSQMDAILVLDAAAPPCITDCNPSAVRLLGYSRDELIGRTTGLLHESEHSNRAFWEKLATAIDDEQPFYMESHTVRKRDGQMLPVRLSAARMQEAVPLGWVLVIHDHSRQKQYEDTLRENEEKFRAIADYTMDWEGWLDPGGRFIWLNPGAERITGYRPDQFTAARDLDTWITMLFADPDAEKAANLFRQALEGREPVNDRHFQIRRKDGDIRWVSLACHPIYSEDGEYRGIRTSIRDITEKKAIERQIVVSEERLKLTLESLRDGVWDWQVGSSDVYFSPRWYTMLGYGPDELPPTYDTWKQLIHPEDRDLSEKKLQQAVTAGSPFEIEFRMKMKDGQWKWILSRGRTIATDDQGRPVRMLGTHMDISERKQMESRMRQSQKLEAMGTLASGIAHDFNNILAGIIGYSELIMDDVPPDSRAYARLNGIISSSERARELISQILTFSRKAEKEIHPVDVRLIAKEAMKLVRASLPATITIEQDIQPGLPYVMGDPTQFHQVIMNLSTNALHAMAGGGTLRISLSRVPLDEQLRRAHPDLAPGDYICLKVSDNGCGIPAEILPRIFDPFFTTKPKDQGTGLGLSVVHGIIKDHGGDIYYDSTVGRGTDVYVYLKVHEQPVPKDRKPAAATFRGSERILMVDDEEVLSVVIQDMLESQGYQVTALTDSLEAHDRFIQSPENWDMILSDITMPGMTGFELARSARRARPDIPIILWSGDHSKIPEALTAEFGRLRIMKKPFRQDQLSRAIREDLGTVPS